MWRIFLVVEAVGIMVAQARARARVSSSDSPTSGYTTYGLAE